MRTKQSRAPRTKDGNKTINETKKRSSHQDIGAEQKPRPKHTETGAIQPDPWQVKVRPAQPTKFETALARLGLSDAPFSVLVSDVRLRAWIVANHNKYWVPERLLSALKITPTDTTW